jgi:hypothetical protein
MAAHHQVLFTIMKVMLSEHDTYMVMTHALVLLVLVLVLLEPSKCCRGVLLQ